MRRKATSWCAVWNVHTAPMWFVRPMTRSPPRTWTDDSPHERTFDPPFVSTPKGAAWGSLVGPTPPCGHRVAPASGSRDSDLADQRVRDWPGEGAIDHDAAAPRGRRNRRTARSDMDIVIDLLRRCAPACDERRAGHEPSFPRGPSSATSALLRCASGYILPIRPRVRTRGANESTPHRPRQRSIRPVRADSFTIDRSGRPENLFGRGQGPID